MGGNKIDDRSWLQKATSGRLWSVNADIARFYKMKDHSHVRIRVKTENGKILGTETMTLSSGREIRLPNHLARIVAREPGPFHVSVVEYPANVPLHGNVFPANRIGDTGQVPILGRLYSRTEIRSLVGGGDTTSFLPRSHNKILCGCFDPEINRRAPAEIDVGPGPNVLKAANLLVVSQSTIPVFIKREINKWEFVGHYKAQKWSKDPVDLAIPERRGDTVGVLFLDRQESSTHRTKWTRNELIYSTAIDYKTFEEIRKIAVDVNIPETTREALVLGRIGQGRFRDSLIERWGQCAVTGLTNIQVLRASHIKPWAASTNQERLDPMNGLLLSPNLDCTFDRGLISFGRNGAILISTLLSGKDLQFLGISPDMYLRGIHSEAFMAYHRSNIFKQ